MRDSATLEAILVELRGLRADLAARSQPTSRNAALVALLHAITAYCNDMVFTSKALVLHASGAPSLWPPPFFPGDGKIPPSFLSCATSFMIRASIVVF